jgi:hypothetical protein
MKLMMKLRVYKAHPVDQDWRSVGRSGKSRIAWNRSVAT